MIRWLTHLFRRRPRFSYLALQDGEWLCRLCGVRVPSLQLGYHARKRHGWVAPGVTIQASRRTP